MAKSGWCSDGSFPTGLAGRSPSSSFSWAKSSLLLQVRSVLVHRTACQIYLAVAQPFRYFPIGIPPINHAVEGVLGFDVGYCVVVALTCPRRALVSAIDVQAQ